MEPETVVKAVLAIKLSDLFRATMPDDCGNEGFIGIAADGAQYHVVVPVDRQIARGLKFWVHPEDGTPFGGYKNWNYFCCLTYETQKSPDAERNVRLEKARENGWLIQKWVKGMGLDIEIVDDMELFEDGFQTTQ